MRALLAMLLLALSLGAHAGLEPLNFDSPEQARRYQELLRELRCTVCQNESLAESKAELAKDMRLRIHQMMLEGQTDAQIKEFLVSRYGDFVLYAPPFQPNTWVLWLGPGVVLLIGLGAMLMVLRKRARALPADAGGIED